MSSGDARTDRMLDRLLDLFERADPFFATTSDAEREQFDALRRPITKLPIIFERDRKYPTLYGDGTTDHERLFPFGELGSIAESPAEDATARQLAAYALRLREAFPLDQHVSRSPYGYVRTTLYSLAELLKER